MGFCCFFIRGGSMMTFEEALKQVEKASKLMVKANDMVIDATMNGFLFTWKWWIAVAMIIIPWVIWAIFRKKESTARLLFASGIIMILSTNLDAFGVENGKWTYPLKAIPIPTISYSFRYSVIPVLTMFFLQYKPQVNPLIKAVIFAGLSAFIGMPLMAMLDMYKKVDWAYTYSFFLLTGFYLLAHWFSRRKSFEQL